MTKDLQSRKKDLIRVAINGLEVTGTSGLEQKGDIVFTSDNTAEVVFTGIDDGQQTVTAVYKGGEPKSTTVTVRPVPAKLQSIAPEVFEKIIGEEQIIELTFDKPLIPGQGYPTVTVNDVLEYSTPFIVNKERTGGSIGLTGLKPGAGTADIQLGGVIVVAKATIKEVPAELLTVTAQPEVFNVDDITEIIAEHDKTPLIENVQFTPSAGLEETEAPHVQGTTVRAKYKGTATGTQRVDITSFRVSKSVTIQVNPKPIVYPILQKVSLSPADVLVGGNVNVEILFDKAEHLFLSDISVLVPEGVSEVTRLAINEDNHTATATYKVEQAGTKEWTVSYKGVTKTASCNVTPLTTVTTFECADTNLFLNEEAIVTATFDKPLEKGQADAKLVVGEGLQIKTPFALNPDRRGGTATLLAVAVPTSRASGTTTATLTLGGVSKQIEFTIAEKPAVLQEITTPKKDLRKNTDFIVTYRYDKAPTLSGTEFSNSAAVTVKTPHKVVGNTIVATYNSGSVVGAGWVKAICGDVIKQLDINVVADAVVATAAPAKSSVEIGEEATINITFDKAFVEGQDNLRATYSEGIAESAAFEINSGKTGGTLKVTASTAGTKTITLQLGGAEKAVTLNVLAKVQPTAIVAAPTSINIGQTSKVTVTFNRAITDPELITVQLPSGLTGATTLTLIESGAKGTVDVTGKTAGAQTVTVSANGTVKTVDITVIADPQLKSVDVTPSTGYPTETEYTVTGTFDKAPNLTDVVIEPQEGLTESVAKALSGNNVVVKYKSTTVGNKTVTFKYKGQTKTGTVVCVEKPATLTNMSVNKSVFLDKVPGDVTVTMTFTGAVPKLNQLHITAPETYFTKKTPAAVSGQTITATYTTKNVAKADAKITAEYLGVTKEVSINIKAASTITTVTIEPNANVQKGDVVTAKATMSAAMPTEQATPTITGTAGLTPKGSVVVAGDRTYVTQQFTVGDQVTQQTVTATSYGASKTANITPVAKAVLSSVTPVPTTVEIGGKSVVTLAFDKAPRLAEVQITADTAKLTESKAKAIAGNNVTVEYTGKAAGAANVSAVHNGVTKSSSITVNPAYAINTVVANPTSVLVGADTTVTATFNRAPVLSDCTFTPSAGLTQKEAPKVAGNTVVAKYTGKTAGAQNVTVTYTGVSGSKKADITVNNPPTPVFASVVANPTSVAVNADTVVTMTFTGAAPVLSKVAMTPSEGLTKKGEIAVSGMTATCTFTGKTAGAQTVNCTYDGGSAKVANVTVTGA